MRFDRVGANYVRDKPSESWPGAHNAQVVEVENGSKVTTNQKPVSLAPSETNTLNKCKAAAKVTVGSESLHESKPARAPPGAMTTREFGTKSSAAIETKAMASEHCKKSI